MSVALEECTPGFALRDILKEKETIKEFESIIYISLSPTRVLPPPQDLINCNTNSAQCRGLAATYCLSFITKGVKDEWL